MGNCLCSGVQISESIECERPRIIRVSQLIRLDPLGERETLLSEGEANYLKTQRIARIATASLKGVPEVSPVGFEFDGKYFWVGSHSQDIFPKTRRYKNITSGSNLVSIVVDDLESVDSWKPRAIKVSGTAQVLEHKGMFGEGKYIRIAPKLSVSWGIEPPKKNGQWSSVKRW